MEEHTKHLESQIGVMVKAHVEMVDAHEQQVEAIQKLQLKMVDLEDHSR